MRRQTIYTVCRSTLLSVTIVCALIFSFGIHSVEMVHEHPGHAHNDGAYHPGEVENILSLHEYIHANEQKLFLFILMSFLVLGSLYVPFFLQASDTAFTRLLHTLHTYFHCIRQRWHAFQGRCRCYLTVLFQKGILHPKSY